MHRSRPEIQRIFVSFKKMRKAHSGEIGAESMRKLHRILNIMRNSWVVFCYRKVGANCGDCTWKWAGRQLPQENWICVIYLPLLWYAELGNWYYTYEYIWYAAERTIVNLILHVIANMHLTAQGFWCYQMLLTHYTRRVNSWNVLTVFVYRHSYMKFKCLFPKII